MLGVSKQAAQRKYSDKLTACRLSGNRVGNHAARPPDAGLGRTWPRSRQVEDHSDGLS